VPAEAPPTTGVCDCDSGSHLDSAADLDGLALALCELLLRQLQHNLLLLLHDLLVLLLNNNLDVGRGRLVGCKERGPGEEIIRQASDKRAKEMINAPLILPWAL
jgi:hypothetical protein